MQLIIVGLAFFCGLALASPLTETEAGVLYKYVAPSPNVTFNTQSTNQHQSERQFEDRLPICRLDDFVKECLVDPKCKEQAAQVILPGREPENDIKECMTDPICSKKIVVHSVEMLLAQQSVVKSIALEALGKKYDMNGILTHIRQQMEQRFAGKWSLIVGVGDKWFQTSVYHKPHQYINLSAGPYYVIIYQ